MIGDIVHISGSKKQETDGALRFSNVYALYEVSHWPAAEEQLIWTQWTLTTISNVENGRAVSSCPPAARTMLNRCIQEGQVGRYSWLFQLLPQLQVFIESSRFATSLGRKPTTCVVEGEAGGLLRSRRIEHATDQPENREDTVAIITPYDPAQRGKSFTGCDERPVYIWINPRDSLVSIKSQAVRSITRATATKRRLPWGLGNVRLARGYAEEAFTKDQERLMKTASSEDRNGFFTQTEWDGLNHAGNDGQQTGRPMWLIPNRPLTEAAAMKPATIDIDDLDDEDLKELDNLAARTFGHTTDARSASSTITATTAAEVGMDPKSILNMTSTTIPLPTTTTTSTTSSSSAQASRQSPPKTPQGRTNNPASSPPGTDSTIAILSSPSAPPSPLVLPPRLRPGRAEHAIEAMRAAARQARSPSKIPRNQAPPKTFGEVEAAAAGAAGPARKVRKRTHGQQQQQQAQEAMVPGAGNGMVNWSMMSTREVRRAVGAARVGVDAGVLDPALFESNDGQ